MRHVKMVLKNKPTPFLHSFKVPSFLRTLNLFSLKEEKKKREKMVKIFCPDAYATTVRPK